MLNLMQHDECSCLYCLKTHFYNKILGTVGPNYLRVNWLGKFCKNINLGNFTAVKILRGNTNWQPVGFHQIFTFNWVFDGRVPRAFKEFLFLLTTNYANPVQKFHISRIFWKVVNIHNKLFTELKTVNTLLHDICGEFRWRDQDFRTRKALKIVDTKML